MDVLASNLPLVLSILWLLYHTVMFATPLVFGSLSLTSGHVNNTGSSAAPSAATQGAGTDAHTLGHAGGQMAPEGNVAAAGGPRRGIPAGNRLVLSLQVMGVCSEVTHCRYHC